ncbi:hypothetical protein AYI70_g2302 [Smittium culicis]|uniref:Uncharacterized protein n=1 Tax=Smittium culicis TaxID=133412 RepID=A0A1R1Y952_9FUNG|nr:hypothetical protein AYI70_g2302 [Smittium culicis]
MTVLRSEFAEEFSDVSKNKIKKVYLKNLKNFGHVKPLVNRPEVILADTLAESAAAEDLADSKADESQAVAGKKKKGKKATKVKLTVAEVENNWSWALNPNLMDKYTNMTVEEARTPTSVIIDAINSEKLKSKDFWTGKTSTPHDWKAALKDKNMKTSL